MAYMLAYVSIMYLNTYIAQNSLDMRTHINQKSDPHKFLALTSLLGLLVSKMSRQHTYIYRGLNTNTQKKNDYKFALNALELKENTYALLGHQSIGCN